MINDKPENYFHSTSINIFSSSNNSLLIQNQIPSLSFSSNSLSSFTPQSNFNNYNYFNNNDNNNNNYNDNDNCGEDNLNLFTFTPIISLKKEIPSSPLFNENNIVFSLLPPSSK